MDEKEYLNSNYSHDSMQRAKKTAKLWIVLSFVGILAGISAAGVFLFEYKLVSSPFLAVLSGKFDLKFFFLWVLLKFNFFFWNIVKSNSGWNSSIYSYSIHTKCLADLDESSETLEAFWFDITSAFRDSIHSILNLGNTVWSM